MKGSEFIKKLKGLSKKRTIDFCIDSSRGRGSHSTVYFGEKFTVVRNLKDELKTGTLHAMLKQLGITSKDLEDNYD